ncbi:MAG: EAL domain-containing protein [Rhodocyclales bacterium]|nr:EAL domain-containing protein [Rhodocyclales bacterium]
MNHQTIEKSQPQGDLSQVTATRRSDQKGLASARPVAADRLRKGKMQDDEYSLGMPRWIVPLIASLALLVSLLVVAAINLHGPQVERASDAGLGIAVMEPTWNLAFWAGLSAFAVISVMAPILHRLWSQRDCIQQPASHAGEARSLRESEAWFRSIFENANTGIASTDSSGRVSSFNEAFRAMLGCDAEVLGRMNLADFTHADDLKLEMAFVKEILARKMDHYRITKRYIACDGRILWGDVSTSVILDAQGAVANFVSVIHDITERRQQEEHTRKLLAENETILGNALVGIVYLKQRCIVSCNRRLEEIFQYGPGELIGESSERLYDSRETFENIGVVAYETVAENKSFSTEVELRHKDGSVFWGALSGRAIDPAHPHDGSIWIYSDITERRQARQYEQFRSRILELLAGDAPLTRILEVIVRGVEQLNPAMLCSILLLDNEGRHLGKGVATSLPDFYNSAIDGIEIGMGVGSCGTAAFSGERVIVEDIATHPYWAPYKELAASAGLGACWSQPVRSSANQMLGTFAIYHHEAHAPGESDIHLIEQSAHLASIAIERRRAAEQLRESEIRFRGLTAMSSDFYWESDAEHRITQRTETAREVAEDVFRHASPIGKRRWEIPHLAPDESGWNTHRALLDAHLPFRDFEIVRLRANGAAHHLTVSGDPVFNSAGEFTGYRGVGRDVTERKQTEADLRIAAAAFESQEAMVITDTAAVILRVNKAYSESTGYTAEELVGQTPRLLRSDRHDADFYRSMWETINSTGGWQGEIWNRHKNGEEHQKWLTISAVKNVAGTVTNYIGTHSDITERKMAEQRINELAFFDQLTGLPNRTLLLDRLKQTRAASSRNNSRGAVLFIDLDNFKTVNDTLGHDMGDLLLKQAAQRLTLCVRTGDTVARLGGDEFVVMLANLSTNQMEAATSIETVAEKIVATLGQIYRLDNVTVHGTASIGITLFSGQLATIDDLMKQADLAMYKAKEAGRNTFRFFDPAMEVAVKARAALEEDLRQALEQKQFLLHYQPQVAGEGQLTGAEVLVRWQHPQRGMVSPAEFIPLAEETGLILPLGNWVLETACTQLALWATQAQLAHLTIAVNVSARQFRQPDFVDQVLRALKNTGANPRRLKLELTESLLVQNVEEIIEKMSALKADGVGFSLDDFGTGYSSLSYLKRLPLDQLKIDQSFVRDVLTDPNDAAIARTVVALANSLGLGVIAEGVETEAQQVFLARSGCHAYQGYLFSKPLPLRAFEQFSMTQARPDANSRVQAVTA